MSAVYVNVNDGPWDQPDGPWDLQALGWAYDENDVLMARLGLGSENASFRHVKWWITLSIELSGESSLCMTQVSCLVFLRVIFCELKF